MKAKVLTLAEFDAFPVGTVLSNADAIAFGKPGHARTEKINDSEWEDALGVWPASSLVGMAYAAEDDLSK